MRTTATINQIIAEWLENTDVTETSKRSYRTKIFLWFRWLATVSTDVRAATRTQVIRYKRALDEKGHSELSVDSYITAVKLFYKYCETVNYHENIAVGVRSSHRKYVHRKMALTSDQAIALVESVDTRLEIGLRDKLIIALMLFYGLRSCEVERLTIDDFEPDGMMKIQRKGRREKRDVIKVSQNILNMFEEYIACRNFQTSDPLIISHSRNSPNRRLSRCSISTMVKARLRSIGIDSPKITSHSLRHTCGCMLIEQGVPLEDVRDILGHTDTTVTRIYVGAAQQQKLLRNNPSARLEQIILNSPKKPKETI